MRTNTGNDKDWLPPKKPRTEWKTPPHPKWCHCERCEFPSVLQSAENERRQKRNGSAASAARTAAILFLGLSVFTARAQDPVRTRSTMFGHPDFGNWLIIRRHDNDPNYHPNWTSIVTTYKPVVRKLPCGQWEIVFSSDIMAGVP